MLHQHSHKTEEEIFLLLSGHHLQGFSTHHLEIGRHHLDRRFNVVGHLVCSHARMGDPCHTARTTGELAALAREVQAHVVDLI